MSRQLGVKTLGLCKIKKPCECKSDKLALPDVRTIILIYIGWNFMVDNINNRLCIIGRFINQNNDTVYSRCYWDGANWIQIGNFDFANTGPPYRMILFDSTIFLGGGFTKQTGAPGNFILKKSVQNTWDTLDISSNGSVRSFGEFKSKLFIGGRFDSWDSMTSFGVMIYQPPLWLTFPTVMNVPWVETMIEFKNELIIGGDFPAYITSSYAGNIISWDGINVNPLDNGLDLTDPFSLITDLEVYKDELYVCGSINPSNISNGRNIVR